LNLMLQSSLATLERIFQLFELVPEDEGDDLKPSIPKINGSITFDNVSFSYDGKREILSDVSFSTMPGELIALVGPSGAGKTTIISLVMQLYRPQKGNIFIDGRDSRLLNLKSIREKIGIVSQDVFMFDTTIANNISYARPDASHIEMQRAAKLAGADEFIQELPAGYNTPVGEGGVMLSTGQRQRISVARAILKNPDVLIFDEPTSAMDPLTEERFKGTLKDLSRGRTTFIIAHRLSTVISADRIFVLDHGRITQSGSHSELLNEDGLYRIMCHTQLLAHSTNVWSNAGNGRI